MRSIIVCGLLTVATPLAQAADNGLYLGAGATQTHIDSLTTDIDLDDTSYKLIVGFRPLDSFAVEVNYVDLGKDRASLGPVVASADAKAYAAYAVGFIPLPLLDLYAKAGLARWETRARVSGAPGGPVSLTDDGTEFAYGAGIQARFGSIGARLEYERFDLEGSDGVELVTLGFTWTFL